METETLKTREERNAIQQHWSNLVRVGKQIAGEIEVEDLSDVPPHLIGRRRAQQEV